MSTRLVVGLGNPGPDYDWTPHNLGFHVVERLADEGGSIFRHATSLRPAHPGSGVYRGPADFTWAPLGTDLGPALLVKPLTFMNLSGEVVAPLADWLGLAPASILVVFDDMDLDLGVRRIRPHGGAGGHRGMESIVRTLGCDRFPRLRVGIGRPRTDAARHVLAKLTGDELRTAQASVEEAALAARDWLDTGDVERCMTRFHSRWKQQATEPAAPPKKETK